MNVLTVSQMRELDRKTIEERGVPGEALMERAGIGAGEHILEFVSSLDARHAKRFVVLAGKGNNGGDAHVVARFLAQNTTIPVRVLSVCPIDQLAGAARVNADRLPENVVLEVRDQLMSSDFRTGDVIIDGLLGTGVKGPLKPPFDNWIDIVNKSLLPVVALDVPSGLNGDDGAVATNAVTADMTVTMGYAKMGMVLGEGPERCGRLRDVDIGIPSSLETDLESPTGLSMTFPRDVTGFIGRVPMTSHKNSRGSVMIVGGSHVYKGAGFLTAQAALRGGSGLVFLVLPEHARAGFGHTDSIITQSVNDGGRGVFTENSVHEIRKRAEDVDAVVIGPGMTREPCAAPVIECSESFNKPILYDADALNLIADHPDRWKAPKNAVLTPHPGEMKRLLRAFTLIDLLSAPRIEQARTLAEKLDAVIALKGNQTVVAAPDGRVALNSSGGPALATAGSGDVLSGVIGALLAQGLEPFDATVVGTFIHGLAGEMGPHGVRGLIADDLPDQIPAAMRSVSPFA